jgi:phosphate transport system substrate-binding protein
MTKKTILGLALMLILIIPTTSLTAYATITPDAPQDGKQYTIKGVVSGQYSTLFKKWTTEYGGIYQGVTTKYSSVGTGNVAYQYSKKSASFAVTDVPLTSKQFQSTPHPVVIPVAVDTIATVYNIPEFQQSGLNLTGQILADIFLGKILFWDNNEIQEINPGVKLPHAGITPIHRSDSAGTTYTFTDYLSKTSNDWNTLVGKGTSVKWKTSAQPSNGGELYVVRAIAKSPYSISYLDLGTAVKGKLTFAAIQNADKTHFAIPSLEGATEAASESANNLPESIEDWSHVSIVNAPGQNSYPIVALSLVLTYQDLNKITIDKDTAKVLVHQVYWDITDGQKSLGSLKLAPLPDQIVELDKRGLSKINFKGTQLFAYDGFVIKPLE